ncbi:MAG: hypothetical protein M3033_07360 [Acidobacteriota bacterium]|nr:hypothetical protein [Acidobacteriota bacterium]
MKNLKILTIIGFSLIVGLAAACSSAGTNTATSNTTTADAPAKNTAVATNSGAANTATTAEKPGEETPAAVKAAFPDANSFTKQHKDLTPSQIASIEKETNAKTPDTDHHSYLAFSTAGGARKQIGAATVVEAKGKEIVIIYDNKEGRPFVKEIRSEGIPAAFLAQFAGKNHDDKFQIGADIKTNGVDDATAKAIAEAVRVDAMTMQTLYGAPDKH